MVLWVSSEPKVPSLCYVLSPLLLSQLPLSLQTAALALGDSGGPDRVPPGLQAIRDGVIEASINHEKGYVQSKEMIDIYSTREPQLAFHQRISFCLDIHNMSVKVRATRPQALGDIGAGLRRRSAHTFYSLVLFSRP